MSTLNAGETLQPFKPLRNNLIFDSSGNLVGIQNDRANGTDLRLNGGSAGTFSSLVVQAAGTFDLYNTADQTTNYERLRVESSSNVFYIRSQIGGSGTPRQLWVGVQASGSSFTYRSGVGDALQGIYTVTAQGTNLVQTSFSLQPSIFQSGTAGYTALDINPTETATGSGTKLLQRWAVGGAAQAAMYNGGQLYAQNIAAVGASGFLGFSSAVGGSVDLSLYRDAADTLALRLGPNAQTFRAYNTYTDGSNYRRWNLSWNTTTAIMQVVGAGTGGNGNLAVGNAALATTDTVGYFMIPSCAGAPTGVPADIPAGQVALHFDSTNNKLYVYDGGWLSTAALT